MCLGLFLSLLPLNHKLLKEYVVTIPQCNCESTLQHVTTITRVCSPLQSCDSVHQYLSYCEEDHIEAPGSAGEHFPCILPHYVRTATTTDFIHYSFTREFKVRSIITSSILPHPLLQSEVVAYIHVHGAWQCQTIDIVCTVVHNETLCTSCQAHTR